MTDREDGRTDETLERDYRLSLEPGFDACPSADELTSLAAGDLPAEARDQIADHAVECGRCSRDLQILFGTKNAVDTELARSPARTKGRWLAGLAAAAAVALAILLLPRARGPAARPEEPVRSAAPETARLVSPGAGAELPAPPEKLAWSSVAGDAGYEVTLFDAGGATVWRSERLTAPSVPLPDDVRRRLSGGRFYWTVRVQRPEGTESRGPYPFSVRAR